MKHSLTCIVAALALSSCEHLTDPNTPLAPPTKPGPYLRTPPPKFSGAGTQQYPMASYPEYQESSRTIFY